MLGRGNTALERTIAPAIAIRLICLWLKPLFRSRVSLAVTKSPSSILCVLVKVGTPSSSADDTTPSCLGANAVAPLDMVTLVVSQREITVRVMERWKASHGMNKVRAAMACYWTRCKVAPIAGTKFAGER